MPRPDKPYVHRTKSEAAVPAIAVRQIPSFSLEARYRKQLPGGMYEASSFLISWMQGTRLTADETLRRKSD